MISIIVSSYNAIFYRQFEECVATTIGVPYELIRVENPGLMGICEAYNKGAAKAKFEYLCFAHEDLYFDTSDWGTVLVKDFNSDPEIGLIGVAGTRYKSWVMSGCGSTKPKFTAVNLIQGNKNLGSTTTKYYINEYNTPLVQVTALDGCFLFTTKAIHNKYNFDENTFKNYHCYDIDFSLSVSKAYKVVVSYNILITHLSSGNFSKDWFKESIKLHKKWSNFLPKTIGTVLKKDYQYEEENAFYNLIHYVIDIKYGYKHLFNTYLSLPFIRIVGIKKWLNISYTSVKVVHLKLKQSKQKKIVEPVFKCL